MPVSGQMGHNLIAPIPEGMCPWYSGPALIPFLDAQPKIIRMLDAPLCMPITDRYRVRGTHKQHIRTYAHIHPHTNPRNYAPILLFI